MLFKKTKKNFYIAIFLQFVKNNTNSLKGQSHDIFFVLGFSSKQILLVPLDMSYWLSYGHFKMTPRCPMYRGVETPGCPMYRGVAKLDPLIIQNSSKYRRVETPPVSYIPGSQDSPVSYEPGAFLLFL